MTRFVDECQKEWRRLGVPTAEANEMAADLEADLAEAQADGASPEQVLGNGYFDPRSFAASWALARGFVRPAPHGRDSITIRIRSLVLGFCALVGVLLAAAGLTIVIGSGFGRSGVAVAVRQGFIGPGSPRVAFLPPNARRFIFPAIGGGTFELWGWLFLAVGLILIVVTLFIWRPWSTQRDGSGIDTNIGMPSLL
jgi:hypothetical protein